MYGKAKVNGYMVINEKLPEALQAEALIALTFISGGDKNIEQLKKILVKFRKQLKDKKL